MTAAIEGALEWCNGQGFTWVIITAQGVGQEDEGWWSFQEAGSIWSGCRVTFKGAAAEAVGWSCQGITVAGGASLLAQEAKQARNNSPSELKNDSFEEEGLNTALDSRNQSGLEIAAAFPLLLPRSCPDLNTALLEGHPAATCPQFRHARQLTWRCPVSRQRLQRYASGCKILSTERFQRPDADWPNWRRPKTDRRTERGWPCRGNSIRSNAERR